MLLRFYLHSKLTKNDYFILSAGHGNHKENSPFLNSSEAGKGSDYYDRNLALFEVNFNFAFQTAGHEHP
uniref:Uncharacterized protein n=1 Tax=Chelydra serpentina TaxID=8475 RepID=A0A8C3S642_CHESE